MANATPSIARPTPPMENFAALFEESLSPAGDAPGRTHHRRSRARRLQHRRRQRRTQVRKLHSDRGIQERQGRSRSQARRLRHRRHRKAGRRLRRDQAVARQSQAPQGLAGSGSRDGAGHDGLRPGHRQGEGRPHGDGQRHPRVPARFAGRHPSGQGHDAVTRTRRSNSRSSSSTASATTSSCRAGPCWSEPGRGAREAPVDAEGRRGRQGHRQEHHRLRRVRRSGRHRRPAAHHRPGLAPRQASVGSARGR